MTFCSDPPQPARPRNPARPPAPAASRWTSYPATMIPCVAARTPRRTWGSSQELSAHRQARLGAAAGPACAAARAVGPGRPRVSSPRRAAMLSLTC